MKILAVTKTQLLKFLALALPTMVISSQVGVYAGYVTVHKTHSALLATLATVAVGSALCFGVLLPLSNKMLNQNT